MKKKYLLGLGGIIAFIAALVLAMTQIRSVRSESPCSTPTPPDRSGWQTPTPTPQYHSQFTSNGTNVLPRPTQTPLKVTDLSPKVADNDKAILIIQHVDGCREEFLIVPEDIDAFIKHLPKGDKLVAGSPPPSIMWVDFPPPANFPSPTITPDP